MAMARSTSWTPTEPGRDDSLTRVVDEGVFPAWSPDGGKILFALGGLHVAATDDSTVSRLLPAAVYGAWSPDGSTIAAAAIEYDQDCKDHHSLILLDAGGTRLKKLLP